MKIDPSWIAQTVILFALGAITYFIKSAVEDLKKSLVNNDQKVKAIDDKHSKNFDKLQDELNELKSDLPIIFVLKEDFIRTLNNVEGKMGNIDSKIDQLIRMNIQRGDKNG